MVTVRILKSGFWPTLGRVLLTPINYIRHYFRLFWSARYRSGRKESLELWFCIHDAAEVALARSRYTRPVAKVPLGFRLDAWLLGVDRPPVRTD
jgi:hypothetical protein